MDKRSFWDRYMRGYDSLALFDDYNAYLDELAAGLDVRPGQTILDAGCGTGNLAIRLASRGTHLVGLDFSATALAQHRVKCPASDLVRASLEEPLPFGDGVFDRVACLSVLFALSPAGARLALREFHRVLKPGGNLVLTAKRPARSKLGLVWRHLRLRRTGQGTGAFLRELLATCGPLLRLLAYNYLMHGLAGAGGYRRLGAEELLEEVRAAGFANARYETTYQGFFHLVNAHRPTGQSAPLALAATPRPAPCA